MEQMDYAQMENKLNELDMVLQQSSPQSVFQINNSNKTLKFVDNIFLYSSLILGGLITICSFIWGIL